MIFTENLKCTICGKSYIGHNDVDEVVCDECRATTLDELSNGKGDEDDE